MKRRLVISDDGSYTLKVEDLNEHYHSTYGALAESMHVFIKSGLYRKLEEIPCHLNIFEVGFGTGLNALLTAIYTRQLNLKVNYFALEAYPLEHELVEQLNYPELIDHAEAGILFDRLHAADWEKDVEIKEGFLLQKVKAKLEEYHFDDHRFDLVYFDAFGPEVQAELWTGDIFQKIATVTSPGGIIVTYSCKGSVKRAMREAGFTIEKLPGPKGKREMLRGTR
jgi:tRNA U34 5-methylaminomethyl-2-thiouridine-forming methyltransferase MnmC